MKDGTARAGLRRENARNARKAAERFFPGEQWKQVEEGIYLSPHRPIGKRSSYQNELRDAQILRDVGGTVYLAPEIRRDREKKFDAIVNGLQFEFKNVGGNMSTLETQFLRSRSQAPNVFINLETSNLTMREAISALYGARNSKTHTTQRGKFKVKGYADYNRFAGGRVILKIKGHDHLIYLNINDLKARR